MTVRVIDHLVSSLASGLMGKDEFIEAVEGQASAMRSVSVEAVAAPGVPASPSRETPRTP